MSRTVLGLIVGATLTLCSAAQAVELFDPTFCPALPATHRDGLDVSDVSIAGVNATGCYGVAPGIADATNIGFTGFAPLLVGAAQGAPVVGSLDGIDFSLAALDGPDFGGWTLGWSGGQGPVTLDVVAVVQTDLLTFSSYFFDDLIFRVSPGSASGSWAINYLVSEDMPSLKAFSIYARDFRGPGGGGETPPPPPTPVDEPTTGGLLALAAIGLALTRRRFARA